jgi:hypothetical protein
VSVVETTLDLSESLLRQAQERAAARGQTLAEFVERALVRQVDAEDEGPTKNEHAGVEKSVTEANGAPVDKNLAGWRERLGTLSPEALAEARELAKYFSSPEFRQVDAEHWR